MYGVFSLIVLHSAALHLAVAVTVGNGTLLLPSKARPRLVEGALLTLVKEEVVPEAADETAKDGSNDWRVDPVVMTIRPDLVRVSKDCAGDTRSKVTGRVEAVCRLRTEGRTNTDNQEAENKTVETSRSGVVVPVTKAEDARKQNGGSKDFGTPGAFNVSSLPYRCCSPMLDMYG